MHFEGHRLTGQRVVEVKLDPVFTDRAHNASIGTMPVWRRELHNVAAVVLLIRVTQLVEHRTLDALQQFGVARTEGLTGGKLEGGAGAFGQTDQAGFHRGSQLASTQRQGGGLVGKGVDDVVAVRTGQPVVQREEGAREDRVQGRARLKVG